MNKEKVAGLFVPNIKIPESCTECPVKRYDINTGDIFCISLNKIVGNCVFDNDMGYVDDACINRNKECKLKEYFITQIGEC